MSLKKRCEEFVDNWRHYEGNDVAEQLAAFIITELGRMADARLDNSVPLALYFANVEDREEFVAAVMEAKPGMISKRWPT